MIKTIFIKSFFFNLLWIFLMVIYLGISFATNYKLLDFITPFYSFFGTIIPEKDFFSIGRLPRTLELLISLWMIILNITIFLFLYHKKYFDILKIKGVRDEKETKLLTIYQKNNILLTNISIWFVSIVVAIQVYLKFFFSS